MLVVTKKLKKAIFITILFILILSLIRCFITGVFFDFKNIFQILFTGILFGAIYYKFFIK